MPGCHAISTAADFSNTAGIASGRPAKSTVTTGLPVATMRSKSCCCAPGRPRSRRWLFSPAHSAGSPSARITTSAFLACLTASSSSLADAGSMIGQPRATRNFPFFTAAFRPACSETTSLALPRACQQPSNSACSSANGPMIAIERVSSGSTAPSFFNSTQLAATASRASARCAATSTSTGAVYGRSKRPFLNFTRRMRRTASSITAESIFF
ncbi:MAG: hypothetical protein BWX86_02806 [Verrucomicrobia bacterium ADurb.Bin122]|nr:MAG: hypothetical protein BWX86_02806 [Verrucomicrobia bacterium ADurb.Bin122]